MATDRRQGLRPTRDELATILEALGVLVISAGVAGLSLAAGLVVLGIGALVFGVALERGQATGEATPNIATPPKPPNWLDVAAR